MNKKWVFLLSLLGIFLVLSAMPVAWAMPEQQGDDWTVPTRTPTAAPPTDPPATDPPATDPPATDPPTAEPSATVASPTATVARTKTPVASTATRTPRVTHTPAATPGSLTPTATPDSASGIKTTETVTTTASSEVGTGESTSGNASPVKAAQEDGENVWTEAPDEESGPGPSPTTAGGALATLPAADRGQTRDGARTIALVIGGGILFLVGLFVLLSGIRRH